MNEEDIYAKQASPFTPHTFEGMCNAAARNAEPHVTVRKKYLALDDLCDDEYEQFSVHAVASPAPSMTAPLGANLNENYLVRNCYAELYDIVIST